MLPRIPLRASLPKAIEGTTPTLSAANGKLNFGATSSNSVPVSHMKSISTLLASPYAAEVLEALREASDRVVENDSEGYAGNSMARRGGSKGPSMRYRVWSICICTSCLWTSFRTGSSTRSIFCRFIPQSGSLYGLTMSKLWSNREKALPKSETAYEQLLNGTAGEPSHGSDV